jgi:hypothetical protein
LTQQIRICILAFRSKNNCTIPSAKTDRNIVK